MQQPSLQTYPELPSQTQSELKMMLHHLTRHQQQQAVNKRKQSTPFRLNEDPASVQQLMQLGSLFHADSPPPNSDTVYQEGRMPLMSASGNQCHEEDQQSRRSLPPHEEEEDESERSGPYGKKFQDSIQQQLSSVLGLAMTAVSGGAHPSALFLQTAANKTAGLNSLLGLNQQEQSNGQPPEAPASSDSSLSGTQPVPNNTKPSGTKGDEDYCDICQKRVCNKYYLKKHKADVHGIFNPPGSGDALEDGMSLVPAQQSPNFSLLASHPGMATNLHGHGTFLTGLQSLMSLGSSPGTPVELLRQKLPHLANSMAAQFSSGSSAPPSAGIFPSNPGLPFPLPSSTAGPGHSLPFPLLHSSQTLNPLAAAMYFSSLASPFAGLLKSSPTSAALAPPTNNNLVTNPCNTTPPSSISATVAGVLPPSAGNLLIRPPLGLEEDKSTLSNLNNQSNSFCSKCQHDFGFPYLLKTHQALFHPQDMLAASHKVGFSVTSLSNSVTATTIQETTPPCTVPSMPSLPVPNSVMSADLATYRDHLEQKMNSGALLQSFQETHQPPNSGLPSAEVAYIDSFRNNMMAAKLADRVTCDVCHKELCNKYFLKTHKMKVHGISITSTNDNSGPAQERHPQQPPSPEVQDNLPSSHSSGCNVGYCSDEEKPVNMVNYPPTSNRVQQTSEDNLSLTLSGVVRAAAEFVNNSTTSNVNTAIDSGAFLFHTSATQSTMATSVQPSPDSKSVTNKASFVLAGVSREASSGGSNHMRVMCDICGKSICNKYFLRTHKRKRHGVCEDLNGMPMIPNNVPPSPSHISPPGDNSFFLRFQRFPNASPAVAVHNALQQFSGCSSVSTPARSTNMFQSPLFAPQQLQQDSLLGQNKSTDNNSMFAATTLIAPHQQQQQQMESGPASSPEAMDFTLHHKQTSPPQEPLHLPTSTAHFPVLNVKDLPLPFLSADEVAVLHSAQSETSSSSKPLNLSKTPFMSTAVPGTADSHNSGKSPSRHGVSSSQLRKLRDKLHAIRKNSRAVSSLVPTHTRCPLCQQIVQRTKHSLLHHLQTAH